MTASPKMANGMIPGFWTVRLWYIPRKDTSDTNTKAHWKHINLMMSTAVEMPTGILLSRSRYAACMGWPPVELGVM